MVREEKRMTVIDDSLGHKIYAMHFPQRKKKGLGIYDKHGHGIVKVATFNDDYSAEMFMEYLADFVGARRVDDE